MEQPSRVTILGGTKGLGRELALCALATGCHTVVTGRTIERCGLREALDSDEAKKRLCLVRLDMLKDDITMSPHEAPTDIFCWVAGAGHKGPFEAMDRVTLQRLILLQLTAPTLLLQRLINTQKRVQRPLQLVVVSSTSAVRERKNEAAYGMVKAGQAQLARNLGQELPRAIPGSKVFLVYPGGMRTGFYEGAGVNTDRFMDPAAVAALIWGRARLQRNAGRPAFDQLTIDRHADGTLNPYNGPPMPNI